MTDKPDSLELTFYPVTPERWGDLERLFGKRGAVGGCWCMWFRLKRSEFEQQKGEGNRQALKRLVDAGETPGILAYAGAEPIGWCSVGPREVYPVLDRSRNLKPVDGQPVWSIVCFFVAKQYRHRGISVRLLQAAVAYAASKGARIVEGYPVDPRKGETPDVFAYVGLESTFRKAGFVEALRRSETRPIMRYFVEAQRQARA